MVPVKSLAASRRELLQGFSKIEHELYTIGRYHTSLLYIFVTSSLKWEQLQLTIRGFSTTDFIHTQANVRTEECFLK
jgi:hypothetical protein